MKRRVRCASVTLAVGIGQNPALWLRIAVGLLFPIALCTMAWQSSRMRGMMSATGLLYLATGGHPRRRGPRLCPALYDGDSGLRGPRCPSHSPPLRVLGPVTG